MGAQVKDSNVKVTKLIDLTPELIEALRAKGIDEARVVSRSMAKRLARQVGAKKENLK